METGQQGKKGFKKGKAVKHRIVQHIMGTLSHGYGTSLAIWDHTVLPAMHPADTSERVSLNPSQ